MTEVKIMSVPAAAAEIKKLQVRMAKLERMLEFGSEFGHYIDNAGRRVPCVITRVFPKAGTVDIVVFDNSLSGGKDDLTGKEIGSGKDQVEPFISIDLEDNDSEEEESLSPNVVMAS